MKISKRRIKHLILESFRNILKESDEDSESGKNQNEIYTKLSPLINSDQEDEFKSGFALLEQLITMESYKSKTEEAIKELAEDLFKKIKETPLSIGNRELEDRANQLYSDLMRIEARDGQAGDEYYFTLAMYNDAEADFHESAPEPRPEAIELHQKLEKVLKLIGLSAPSFTDIYGQDFDSQSQTETDDDYSLLDDIDFEALDYEDLDFSDVDPKYEFDDSDYELY